MDGAVRLMLCVGAGYFNKSYNYNGIEQPSLLRELANPKYGVGFEKGVFSFQVAEHEGATVDTPWNAGLGFTLKTEFFSRVYPGDSVNVHYMGPNPDVSGYMEHLNEHGDGCFVLGFGTDGHIGYNFPASSQTTNFK